MSENHKNCVVFKLLWKFLYFISAVSGCVLIFAFASSAGVPVGTASSVVGIEVCSITTAIKNCMSFIEKDRKKDDKIAKLNKLIS